jgi:hypothetical protein
MKHILEKMEEWRNKEARIIASEPIWGEEFLKLYPYANDLELAAIVAQSPGEYPKAIKACRFPAMLKGIR